MASNSTTLPAVMALQAPLLSLAYTLTGDRKEAYSLLRDTTRNVMSAPGAFATRESLFAAMRSIYTTSYRARAERRRLEVSTRSYHLPSSAAYADENDAIPAGTLSVNNATYLITTLSNRNHSRALALRAVGYSLRDIASATGVSVLRACLRVTLAAISLRAAASLCR